MSFLEYHKEEKLEFNHKKSCGLWLIVVGLVIALATLIGGKQIINMQVFSFGYIISFLSINMNKKLINNIDVFIRGTIFCNRKLEINLVGCIDGYCNSFFSILFCSW